MSTTFTATFRNYSSLEWNAVEEFVKSNLQLYFAFMINDSLRRKKKDGQYNN